jgi:hypothetical protein
MNLKTTKTLVPGQPGTQKWVRKYGDSLVCVRYKEDPLEERKLITVELIESSLPVSRKQYFLPSNKIVLLRIQYDEIQLRTIVKNAGGRWNRERKAWELPYGQARVCIPAQTCHPFRLIPATHSG